MATHRSAEKRHRQSLKRRARNRLARATYRTAIKSAVTAAEAGTTVGANKEATNAGEVKDKTQAAVRLLDKAARHGIVHKKNAARKISRLQKRVNTLLASKSA